MELLEMVSGAVWSWPTAAALMAAGAVLSYRLGFVQFRCLWQSVRTAWAGMRSRGPGGRSSFEAVCTALAGTVGTGNIAGVCIALSLGGPGAVFWMWVSALLGMGTKYAEILLAVRYRVPRGGGYVGGPMYYIEKGLGGRFRPLAVVFAGACVAASFGSGSMLQVGSVVTALRPVIPPPLVGACMALALVLCLRGGDDRGRAAALLTPLMAGLYVLLTLTVVLVNIGKLPVVLREIFACAVLPRSAIAGAAGVTVGRAMSWGLRRGMFSNEAGLGSSPIAHASARVSRPEDQALLGIFEVFVDTLVICTLTALAVLCSGVPIRYGTAGGAEYCSAALASVFGEGLSGVFMAVSMFLFALSSILSWSVYGERSLEYLTGGRGISVYRALFAGVTLVSSFFSLGALVRVADILTAAMLAPNILALLLLTGKGRRR